MRKHRGLSAVIGTVFLVAVVIGALSYVTYSMNILGNFSESLITEEKRQKDKQGEDFEITSVNMTATNKLDGVVTNTGQVPLEIKSLWIEEVGTPNSVKKFDIGTTIAPGDQLNLINNVDFDMSATKGYALKMISGRGDVQTFYVNSVGSDSFYLNSYTIPKTISTEFDTAVIMTVTNNSTNNAPILNLTPVIAIDVSTCTPDCTATYVSGPTPSSYPSLRQGETATFSWVYTVTGEDANQITFTTSLLNGVVANQASAVVEVRDVVSATESGTALTSVGLQSNSIDSSILLFHAETDRTPSTSYQMFSATADAGANGLKIDLDTTTPNFFTYNASNPTNIPAGSWTASHRFQSEAMPTSLKNEGEDMIFHFNANEVNPDNSEGTANADLEGCGLNTMTPIKISVGTDDAEEVVSTGAIDRTNSDLEMAQDGSTIQMVGLRFTGIPIPQGSTIQSAYVQFTTDESQTGNTVNVRIRGEASDDAAAISTTAFDISGRTDTSASVTWSAISGWSTVPETGTNQKTPDIKTIIQEIVNRGGWASGNDILITIENNGSTSSTRRTAEPFEGGSTLAPELQITYSPSSGYGGPPTYDSTAGPHTSGTYRFDGVNDCFRSMNILSSSDGNDIAASPDDTALWFKTFTTVGATEQRLVSWEGSGTCPSCDYYKIALEATTGKVVFEYNMDLGISDTVTCKSTSRYDNGQWYHLVAVRPEHATNDTCNLYITTLAGTTAETISGGSGDTGSSLVDADGRWYIGSNGAESGNFFNGWIDDVIHWGDTGEVLDATEAADLARVNYGSGAHRLNLYIDKSDQDGVNLSNLATVINATVPFYDPKAQNDDADSTYGTYNYTSALGAVTIDATQRLNYTISSLSSTSSWNSLELDMKIDDQDMTPMTSLLQIPPPDEPFPSYWVYDKSNKLLVPIYNVGPYGSWFVYQGTRAVFDSPTGTTSYAAIICSVNMTSADYCTSSTSFIVSEHRDSIFIPVGAIANIYFYEVQDRPDANNAGGNLIPAGEYDMYVFIDGYDETGAKFMRQVEMGRVRVQD